MEIEVHKLKQRCTASYQQILCSEGDSIVGLRKYWDMVLTLSSNLRSFQSADSLMSFSPVALSFISCCSNLAAPRGMQKPTLFLMKYCGNLQPSICTIYKGERFAADVSLILVATATGRQI